MLLPLDEFNNHFRSVEEEGKLLIYCKDAVEPVIRGKSRGKSRDGCSGYPLEDLAALWYFACLIQTYLSIGY